MPLPWQRVKPHPYDLTVQRDGGPVVGVRLKPSADGQLIGRQVRRGAAVSPTTYGYDNYDPFTVRPFVFGPLTGGVGESVQSSARTRYKYARRADCSIGGQRRTGPYFHSETLAAGEIVNHLAVGKHAGAETLFGLVGTHVYVNVGGAWTLSRTGGSANLHAVQYKGTAGSDSFWVTNEAGELWAYDGAAWAQAVLPATFYAYYVDKVGDELWVFGGDANGNNVLRIVTTGDPLLAASYGGAIFVGSADKRATWIRALDNQAFLFKEDGVFSVVNDSGTVTVNDLFPELRNVTEARYGRNASVWKGALWFQFGETFWRLTGGGTAVLEPIGPERLLGLDPRLRRPGVAFAGHGTWFGYLVTEATDLLKFGEWVNADQPGEQYQFNDAWNGSLADWSNKTATTVFVTDRVNGQPRLYVGFNDGTVEWSHLPQNSPDPADDARCEFVTGDTGEESYVEWPDHHGEAPADNKHWRAFAATGQKLDQTHYVRIGYRVDDPDGTWLDLGTDLNQSGVQRLNTSGSVAGLTIQIKENLHGTRTTTPEVTAVVLHEQVRPAEELEYTCVALAKHNAPRLDGSVDRRTAEQIRTALKATAGAGPTTIWFPDGSSQDVDFVAYGEALPNPNARWGVEWEIPLAFVQWKINTTRGTHARMMQYTHAQLMTRRHVQLMRL